MKQQLRLNGLSESQAEGKGRKKRDGGDKLGLMILLVLVVVWLVFGSFHVVYVHNVYV